MVDELKRERLMDCLFAFSLANLNLGMSFWWRILIHSRPDDLYLLPTFGLYHYVSATVTLVALTAIIWASVRWFRRTNNILIKNLGRLAFLIALFNPINYFRSNLLQFDIEGILAFPRQLDMLQSAVALAVFGIVLFALAYHYKLAFTVLFFIVFLPFLYAFSNLALLAWYALTADGLTGDDVLQISTGGLTSPRGRTTDGAEPSRVVWIIFDEWDYRLSFPERPEAIDLPELDRLRRGSFFATNALEPGPNTLKSIPSFLLGRPVVQTMFEGPSELWLKLDTAADVRPETPEEARNRGFVPFTEHEDFFTSARLMTPRIAILGVGHPYCRMFSGFYVRCYNRNANGFTGLRDPETFSDTLISQAHRLLPQPLHLREQYSAVIKRSLELAKEFAADPTLDLAYLHILLPHGGFLYDRKSARFVKFGHTSYFDNLVLVDRWLGEMRLAMESSGTWERTTLLVTSDHRWRCPPDGVRDHRVPFILKLAERNEPLSYEQPMSARAAKDILLAIMSGELGSVGEVAAWLDARGGYRGE